MRKYLYITAIAFLFCGCSVLDTKPAEKVVQQFYSFLKTENYTTVPDIFTSDFYTNVSKEAYKTMLINNNKLLGHMENYKLTGWDVRYRTGKFQSGKYYTLTYAVEYANYRAIETVILYRSTDRDVIKIKAYDINSSAFQKR